MDYIKFLTISIIVIALSGCGMLTQKHEIICTDRLPPPPADPDPIACDLSNIMEEATVFRTNEGEMKIIFPLDSFDDIVLCLADTRRFIEDQDGSIQYCKNVIQRIQEDSELNR